MATQWRVAAAAGGMMLVGLDYAGARARLRASGLRVTPELWAALRVMEIAAIDAAAEG